MEFGAALLALSAVQSINQIGQGYAQKAEANLNATIIEGKAGLIDVQKDIESRQYDIRKGQVLSESMARTGAAGIKPTGSALTVMLNTQKQMSLDQAIGQFNYEQEKRFTLAEADAMRRSGKAAVSAGWSNAFTTMLTGAAQYGMYKGGNRLTQQGTVKDTTFDSIVSQKRGNTIYTSRTVK